MTGKVVRTLLLVLAVSAAVVGLWAQFAPLSFYRSFPLHGHAWVGADGPYNEHLIRDVGGLNLALALLSVTAAVRLSRSLVRVAAGAWVAYGVPHVIYHALHIKLHGAFDLAGELGLLIGGVVMAVVVLALSGRVVSSGPEAPAVPG